jgi:hypothetical protein
MHEILTLYGHNGDQGCEEGEEDADRAMISALLESSAEDGEVVSGGESIQGNIGKETNELNTSRSSMTCCSAPAIGWLRQRLRFPGKEVKRRFSALFDLHLATCTSNRCKAQQKTGKLCYNITRNLGVYS